MVAGSYGEGAGTIVAEEREVLADTVDDAVEDDTLAREDESALAYNETAR